MIYIFVCYINFVNSILNGLKICLEMLEFIFSSVIGILFYSSQNKKIIIIIFKNLSKQLYIKL